MKKFKPILWIILTLAVLVPLISPQIWQNDSEKSPEGRLLKGSFLENQSQSKWISITGQPQDIAVLDFSQTGTTGQSLHFKMPGFYLEPVLVGSRPCSRVHMPKQIMLQTEGMPEVPVLSRSLVVPPGSTTTLKIIKQETQTFKVDPVEPSLGHLTRDVNPLGLIPRFDDFYEQNSVWPKQVVEVGKIFTLRGVSGVNIRLYPIHYDAGKGLLLVTKNLVVDIITTSATGYTKTQTVELKPGHQEFQKVYQQIFDQGLPSPGTNKYNSLPSRGRMLIVAHESLAESMDDFVAWKQQLGIDVTLRTGAELGGTNTSIGTAIADMYKDPLGLVWVILVGDKQQMPTNSGGFDGSDSDSRYAMIDGNDLYPDLYISRISATDTTELQTQVNKFIAYEKYPATGQDAAWYQHGIGIASDEGSPTDYERAELLRTQLLGYGFHTVDQIYQGLGAVSRVITTALNEGASVVNYLGHGSGTSWDSVYFSNTQVRALDNGPHWPWIVDVSCSNGEFGLDECMSEAWLRAGTPDSPQGAIGVISASSLAPWVPPTVMQAEVINLLTQEDALTLGSLFYSGLMEVLDRYNGVSVAERVIDQNVVFGDCSLMVRTSIPGSFAVSGPDDLASTATVWSGQVTGPAGAVAALTWDGVLYGVGMVGDDGTTQIYISTSLEDAPQLQLTVSGFNMVPYLEMLSMDGRPLIPGEPDDGASPTVVLPSEVLLRGNHPNPFNPSTHIVFELPSSMNVRLSVYDIRGHLVKQLLNESLGSGSQDVLWDGSDSQGKSVSSGVYLYRLETPEGAQNGRMTLSK